VTVADLASLYISRASAYLGNEQEEHFALADITAVLSLEPGDAALVQALIMRAKVHIAGGGRLLGGVEGGAVDVFVDLKRAAELDPTNQVCVSAFASPPAV
jgi:hypothetical protein